MKKVFTLLAIVLLFQPDLVFSQSNTNLGNSAGNSGSFNTSLGYQAGDKVTGSSNTFAGAEAGEGLTSGSYNTFSGRRSGFQTNGSRNLYSGYGAGYYSTSGDYNVYLGFLAGYHTDVNGSNNVFIGAYAGAQNSGSNNVFIGHNAGRYQYSASNKLFIGTNGSNPLIYGDFSSSQVAIGTNNPTGSYRLYVSGDAYATGLWISSDARFKKNEQLIGDALSRVRKMNGVSYEFKGQEDGPANRQFAEGNQLGFMAQELQKVLPEAVRKDDDGYLAVNYQAVIPVLVEAIKELSAEVEGLRTQLASISSPADETIALPKGVSLGQNWPNPSDQSTHIPYSLPEVGTDASISVFDLQGRKVSTFDKLQQSGEVVIPVGDLKPGLYYYSMVVDGRIVDTKKMIIK